MTAQALGFERPTANSLDSVADRDFVLETLAAATITAVHLSRFAEEIVLWMTPQFGFIRLSDGLTTGSSIMPQKRNPDAAELVRAKVGRIAGAFQGLVLVMKGLPLAYSKDMQEDKEATFDALSALALALTADAHGRGHGAERGGHAGGGVGGATTATDLADWLVRTLKVPFREAHHVTGAIVKAAEGAGWHSSAARCPPGDRAEDHEGRLFRVDCGELCEESDELWGNCATERPQNGARLAQALGTGRRSWLDTGVGSACV